MLVNRAPQIIQMNPLFANFDVLASELMLHHSTLLFARQHQFIYKQGETANQRAYIVLSGAVDLKGYNGHKEEFVTLGVCHNGQSFGEEGVFESGHIIRVETAIAQEDTYILELTKERFCDMQHDL